MVYIWETKNQIEVIAQVNNETHEKPTLKLI